MTRATTTETDRHRIAAEVLELGETLFDAVLEAASHPAADAALDPFPESELRTAADEFFRAVRGLLGFQSTESGVCDGDAIQGEHREIK